MSSINIEQVQQLVNVVYVLVIAVIALGTVGMGAAVLSLRMHKDTLKMLYASADPETQKLLRGAIITVRDLADLAVEVTAPGSLAGNTGPLPPFTTPVEKAATAESLTPYVVTESQPPRTEAVPPVEATKSAEIPG